MNIEERTPAYIYIIGILLAVPISWMLVGLLGENVPGMIVMIVTGICWLAITALLSWSRVRILRRQKRTAR